MPDPGVVARDALADIEDRMGLPSIDALLAERADLIKRVAPLRARHGSFGTYNDLRKVELAQISTIIRAEALKAGTKVTEAFIEEQSHASERYADWVARETEQKAEWTVLEDQIQAINDQINRGQAVARFLAAEIGLTR